MRARLSIVPGVLAGVLGSAAMTAPAAALPGPFESEDDRMPETPGQEQAGRDPLGDPEPVHPGHDVGGGDPGVSGVGGVFPSMNMELLGHIALADFGPGGRAGADCWGYVSPSGREYAIIGLSDAFSFVEVTDPIELEIVATFFDQSSSWRDVKTFGEYAYGVSEAGVGLQVFDLSDIDNGNVAFVGAVTSGGSLSTHNVAINEQSGYLYRLAGGSGTNIGLRIYDLNADPANPPLVKTFNQFYIHDAQIVTYTSGAFAGREIAFCCSGFNGGGQDTRLRIVDVTDKNNIFVVSSVAYSGRAYCHQGWLSEDRQYFYINDELDEVDNNVATTTTRIIDVSDIENPAEVGSFSSGLPSIDHNLYTHDGMIFETNYTSGLRVFDAGDPMNPVEVAWLDTYPSSDAPTFNGAWSSYPYLPSGNILISDIQQGLLVARLAIDRVEFSLHQGLPQPIDPDGCTNVHVQVVEVGLEHDPETMRLYVEEEGGGVTEYLPEMLPGFGDYDFWIGELACGQTVRYWIECYTPEGVRFRAPSQAPVVTFEAYVSESGAPSFTDNFETDQGWTSSGSSGTGQWTRGVPVNNGLEDPPSDYDGSGSCLMTGNDPGDAGVGFGDAVTEIGPIPFSPGGGSVKFAYWYNGTRPVSLDKMRIWVKRGAGAWEVARTINEIADVWHTDSITFGPNGEFPGTTEVSLRFEVSNSPVSNNTLEAAIDGIEVVTIDCTPDCIGDLDDSGVTDVFDFTMFANDFGAPVSTCTGADFDADGVVSVFDFTILAGDFGCFE